jgi:hypothetical protein
VRAVGARVVKGITWFAIGCALARRLPDRRDLEELAMFIAGRLE